MRIYRQGFEFLIASKDRPGFLAGLNFVSFQNTPERLFKALTYRHRIAQKIPQFTSTPSLEQFMSVHAAREYFLLRHFPNLKSSLEHRSFLKRVKRPVYLGINRSDFSAFRQSHITQLTTCILLCTGALAENDWVSA